VHRASNTDDPVALAALIEGLGGVGATVLWAVHPRTRARLAEFGLEDAVARATNVRVLDPVPYIETVALLRSARALLTDSGGMQKEAYFFGVPCVTLRDETEWVETVQLGWNTLVGTNPKRIVEAAAAAVRPAERPQVYGDGHAAARVATVIEEHFVG
jgi:UDP-GlcNAc3NAcA epimerase